MVEIDFAIVEWATEEPVAHGFDVGADGFLGQAAVFGEPGSKFFDVEF